MGERSGPVLHLPKSKSIDIEFENIVCSVPGGRRGKTLQILFNQLIIVLYVPCYRSFISYVSINHRSTTKYI